MPHRIEVLNERHEKKQIPIDHLPDICPVCKKAGKPMPLTGHFYTDGPPRIRIAFLCPVTDCSEVFVASYHNSHYGQIENITSTLQKTQALRSVEGITFPASVATLSPFFVTTFNQSHVAEVNTLDQIAGPGYRKSLEFLIKDFLVAYKFKNDSKKGEHVRSMFLGRCISELIDEDRIKQCAKRAAWLGNDETHYTRVWQEKDIRDLKALIQMTVNWIDLIVQSDAYLQEMPEKDTANQASRAQSENVKNQAQSQMQNPNIPQALVQ